MHSACDCVGPPLALYMLLDKLRTMGLISGDFLLLCSSETLYSALTALIFLQPQALNVDF